MTERNLAAALAVTLTLLAVPAIRAEAQAEQRYRLVEVGGSPLPVEVEKGLTCREHVTRGTLTLGADSLWSLQYTQREVCGDRAEVETEHEGGRYSMVADTIRFHDDDDDDDDRDWSLGRDVDVDDLETGTLAADGTLTVRLRDGKTTIVFRR